MEQEGGREGGVVPLMKKAHSAGEGGREGGSSSSGKLSLFQSLRRQGSSSVGLHLLRRTGSSLPSSLPSSPSSSLGLYVSPPPKPAYALLPLPSSLPSSSSSSSSKHHHPSQSTLLVLNSMYLVLSPFLHLSLSYLILCLTFVPSLPPSLPPP